MEIVQIVSVALIATFIIMLIKQYRPEYAIYISIIAGVIIFAFVVLKLNVTLELLKSLSTKIGMNSKFFGILLKITGIAYLAEFGVNICKDSGETAIASKIELASKVLIITMSIPILSTLLDTILGIIN